MFLLNIIWSEMNWFFLHKTFKTQKKSSKLWLSKIRHAISQKREARAFLFTWSQFRARAAHVKKNWDPAEHTCISWKRKIKLKPFFSFFWHFILLWAKIKKHDFQFCFETTLLGTTLNYCHSIRPFFFPSILPKSSSKNTAWRLVY